MGKGVLLSVENHELPEVVGLAKKFDDLKMPMYATAGHRQRQSVPWAPGP